MKLNNLKSKALKVLLSILLILMLIPTAAIPKTAWAAELANTVGEATQNAVAKTSEALSMAIPNDLATSSSSYYPDQTSYTNKEPGSAELTQSAAFTAGAEGNTNYQDANLTLTYTTNPVNTQADVAAYDYLFMIDVSQNMGEEALAKAKEIAASVATAASSTGTGSRFGYIAFNENRVALKNFNKSTEGFISNLEQVVLKGGSKSYINAITEARTMLSNRSSSGANPVSLVWLTNGTVPESAASIADAMNKIDDASGKTLRTLCAANSVLQLLNGSTATQPVSKGLCDTSSLCQIVQTNTDVSTVANCVINSPSRSQVTSASLSITIDTNNFKVINASDISAPGFSVEVGEENETTHTQLLTFTQNCAIYSGTSISINIPLRTAAKHNGINAVTSTSTKTTMYYTIGNTVVRGQLQPDNVGLTETGYKVTYETSSTTGRSDIPVPTYYFPEDNVKLAMGYGLVPTSVDGHYFSKWLVSYTGSGGKVEEVYSEGDNFTMPAAEVTITPLFNKQSISKTTSTIGNSNYLVYPGFEYSTNAVKFDADKSIFSKIKNLNTATAAEFKKVDSMETVPENAIDVSTTLNGSIKAYLDTTSTSEPKLIVCSMGSIVCSNTSLLYMFKDMTALKTISFENLITSSVSASTGITTLEETFSGCSALESINLLTFDTSQVTTLKNTFNNCFSITSLDLHSWDVSNVTTCENTFTNCGALTYINLEGWSLKSCSNFSSMFNSTLDNSKENNVVLGLSDLLKDNTVAELNFSSMFYGFAYKGDLDLSSWNIKGSQKTSLTLTSMFDSSLLTSINLSGWNDYESNIEKVTSTANMFANCPYLVNKQQLLTTTYGINLEGWNLAVCTDASNMFYNTGYEASDSLSIKGLDGLGSKGFGSSANLEHMFDSANLADTLDLSKWNITNAVNFESVFENLQNISNIKLSRTTSLSEKVTVVKNMFKQAGFKTNLTVDNLDILFSNSVTYLNNLDFSSMFENSGLSGDVNLSYWSGVVAKVKNFERCFYNCNKLSNLTITNWKATTCTNFKQMFMYCGSSVGFGFTGLQYLCSDGVGTDANMQQMFAFCNAQVLYLAGSITNDINDTAAYWNVKNVANTTLMFSNCKNLTTIYANAGTNWGDTSQCDPTLSSDMFLKSERLVGGEGTTYLESNVGISYARIDNVTSKGSSSAGYFTEFVDGVELAYPGCEQSQDPLIKFDLNKSIFNKVSGINVNEVQSVEFVKGSTESLTGTNVSSTGGDTNKIIAVYDSATYKLTITCATDIIANAMSLSFMFKDFSALTSVSFTNFNNLKGTSFSHMFDGCSSIENLDLKKIQSELVTDASYAFYNCSKLATLNISGWSLRNCSNMMCMFANSSTTGDATQLAITGIEGLCKTSVVSGDVTMKKMFDHSNVYSSALNLNGWDVSKVNDMSGMFDSCSNLTGVSFTDWNVAKVGDFSSFLNCSKIVDTLDMSNWSLSAATNTSNMFNGSTALISIKNDNWGTSNITNASNMFSGCSAMAGSTEVPSLNLKGMSLNVCTDASNMFKEFGSSASAAMISNYDTLITQHSEDVITMESMFCNSGFSSLDLSKWDMSKTINLSSMFGGCAKLTTLNLSNWDLSSATNVSNLFSGCTTLSKIESIAKIGTTFSSTNVIVSEAMFNGCKALKTLSLSAWNTSKFNSYNSMFKGCSALTTLDVSDWNHSSLNDFTSMFEGCSSLDHIEGIESFINNLAANTRLDSMLKGCSSFVTLDVSDWSLTNCTSAKSLFEGCTSLSTILAKENTDWSTLYPALTTTSTDMFKDCQNVRGREDTVYSESNVDVTYAKIDKAQSGSPSAPGYFTYVKDAKLSEPVDTEKKTSILDQFNQATSVTFVKSARPEASLIKDAAGIASEEFGGSKWDIIAYKINDTTNADAYHVVVNCDGNISCSPLSCRALFNGFSNLTSVSFSNFNPAGITDLSYMFGGCTNLNSVNLSGFSNNINNVTKAESMFDGAKNLTNINLKNWHFGPSIINTTKMFSNIGTGTSELFITGIDELLMNGVAKDACLASMFANNIALKSIELTSWNTSKAGNVSSMFEGCCALESITTYNMRLESATNITSMFKDCSKLATANVYSLCASGVGAGSDGKPAADLTSMFENCSALTSINIPNWNLTNAINLNSMFKDSGLASIDISKWSGRLKNVTDMSNMFSGCTQLADANLKSVGFDAAKTLASMFEGDKALTKVTLTGNVTKTLNTAENMFKDCEVLSDVTGMENLLADGTTYEAASISGMFQNCKALPSNDLSAWKVANVTNVSSLFSGCVSLNNANITNWSAAKMTDLSNIFNGCSSLATIKGIENLLKNKTANGTTLSGMFQDCKSLTTLSLEEWDTTLVGNTSYMFSGCYALKSVFVKNKSDLADWSKGNEKTSTSMFDNCSVIVGKQGTTYDSTHVDISYAHLDDISKSDNPGYFTSIPYTVLLTEPTNSDAGILDKYKNATTVEFTKGQIPPKYEDKIGVGKNDMVSGIDYTWDIVAYQIKNDDGTYKVVVNCDDAIQSDKLSCVALFRGFENLTSVKFDNLDISLVTSLEYMFYGCKNLQELDLSQFGGKVSSVTNASHMFDGCSSLNSLKINNWNFSPAFENATYMFANLTADSELNVSGLNTLFANGVKASSGTDTGADLSYMFYGSSAFETISLQGSSIANANDLSYMFSKCSGVKSINLTNVGFDSTSTLQSMFAGDTALTTVTLSGNYAKSASNFKEMFADCSALTTLTNINNLCSSGVKENTDFTSMFKNCSSLASFSANSWKLANVKTLTSMFYGCSSLTTCNFTAEDLTNAQDMSSMFSGCEMLKTITRINTLLKNNTVENINLSKMFNGCSALTSLDLSKWTINKAINLSAMFANCQSLYSVNLTGWLPTACTDYSNLFDGDVKLAKITGIENLFASGAATDTNANAMFKGCVAITTLNLAAWDTSNIVSSKEMFMNCSQLNTIFVDIDNPELADWSHIASANSTNMFKGCENIVGREKTTYKASNANDSSYAKIDKRITEGVEAYFTAAAKPAYLAEPTDTTGQAGILDKFNEATSVEFVKDQIPETYDDKIFVDKNNTGAIIAFKVYNEDGTYKVIVNCQGEIIASPLSFKALFSNFFNLSSVNYANLNFSAVTDTSFMFNGCSSMTNINLSTFSSISKNITSIEDMFKNCTNTTSINLSNWVFAADKLSNASSAFEGIYGSSVLNIQNVNNLFKNGVAPNSDFNSIFKGTRLSSSFNIKSWKMANVSNFSYAFAGSTITTTDFAYMNFASTSDFSHLFDGCASLTSVKNLGTMLNSSTQSSVMLSGFFANCTSLKSIDLNGLSPTIVKCTDLDNFFNGCYSLSTINNIDSAFSQGFAKGTSLESFFEGCSSLAALNVQKWDILNVVNMSKMFKDCESLSTITANESTDWSKSTALTSSTDMFLGCGSLVGVEGTSYNEKNPADKTYAKVDRAQTGSPKTPGYFSYPVAYLKDANSYTGILSRFNGATSVSFVKNSAPATFSDQIDVSNTSLCKKGSVIAYKVDDAGGTYHVVVNSDTSIFCSEYSLYGMFYNFTNLTSLTFNNLDISIAEDMSYLFYNCSKLTDVSSFAKLANRKLAVTAMAGSFYNTTALKSCDLSSWGEYVSKIENIDSMFACSGVSQVNLAGWDVSHVTTFNNGFYGCQSLASLNIDSWRLSSCKIFSNLFRECKNLATLNGIDDVCKDGTGDDATFACMFVNTSKLSNLKANWNVSNVIDMSQMFYSSALINLDIFGWSADKCSKFSEMFTNCSKLKTISGIGSLCANLTTEQSDMTKMFYGCSSLTSLDLSTWNFSPVSSVQGMFYSCTSMVDISLQNADISKCKDLHYLFALCTELISINLTNCKADGCTNFSYMFAWCSKLADLSSVRTLCASLNGSNINMDSMFFECSGVSAIDISAWKTDGVVNTNNMFAKCSNLKSLDVSNFSVASLTSATQMFAGCGALTTIWAASNTDWSVSSVLTSSTNMFINCDKLAGSQGTKYTTSKLDKAYAKTDKAKTASNPGYFTDAEAFSYLTECSEDGVGILDEFKTAKTVTFVSSTKLPASGGVDVSSRKDGSIIAYWESATNVKVVSKATIKANPRSLASMFCNFADLQSYNFGDTDLTMVNDLSYMFSNCGLSSISFDFADKFITGVYSMSHTFDGAKAASVTLDTLKNKTLSLNDVSYMFSNSKAISTIDMANVYLSNVTDFSYMFSKSSVTSINATGWQLSKALSCTHMFAECSNLTTITNVANLFGTTSNNLTDASYLFYKCSALTSLMLSFWNTSVFSNFEHMFDSCTSLTSVSLGYAAGQLEVSYFIIYNATNASYMFANCSKLSTISCAGNLINSNSPNNINMSHMFENCTSLTDSILTNIKSKGSHISNLSYFHSGCSGLVTIDLRGLSVSGLQDTSYMFNGCGCLKTIFCDSTTNWNTEAKSLNSSANMFSGCTKLTGGEGSAVADKKVYDKTYAKVDRARSGKKPGYFTEYIDPAYLKSATTTQSIFYKYKEATSVEFVLDEAPTSYLDRIDVSLYSDWSIIAYKVANNDSNGYKMIVNSDYLINCSEYSLYYMFDGFSSLKSVKFDNFYTSRTIYCAHAFANTPLLESINISGWDLSKVTFAHQMFLYSGCKSIDMSNVVFKNVTDAAGCFAYTTNLSTITGLNDLLSQGTGPDCTLAQMFACSGSSAAKFNLDYWNIENVVNVEQMFLSFNGTSISLRGLVFNATSLKDLFRQSPNLKYIYLQDCLASNCSDFTAMFANCPKLEFTNNVADLFRNGCGANADLTQMYASCTSLKSVHWASADLQNVDKMVSMFEGDSSMTLADFSNTKAYNVTSLYKMFYHCTSLKEVDIRGWKPQKCQSFMYMFDTCKSLQAIFGIESLFSSEGTYCKMNCMFAAMESMKTLDLSKWDVSKVIDMSEMFTQSSGLENINVTNWDTRNCESFLGMFLGCSGLKTITGINTLLKNGSNFSTTCDSMFCGCSSLEGTLNLNGWNTSKVTSFYSFIDGCSSLQHINISNWNINNCTSFNRMFCNCGNLTRIYTEKGCGWYVSTLKDKGIKCSNVVTNDDKLEAEWICKYRAIFFCGEWAGMGFFQDTITRYYGDNASLLNVGWPGTLDIYGHDDHKGIFTGIDSNENGEPIDENGNVLDEDVLPSSVGSSQALLSSDSQEEHSDHCEHFSTDSSATANSNATESNDSASTTDIESGKTSDKSESSSTDKANADSSSNSSDSSKDVSDSDAGSASNGSDSTSSSNSLLTGIDGAISTIVNQLLPSTIADAADIVKKFVGNAIEPKLTNDDSKQLYDMGQVKPGETITYSMDICNDGSYGAEVDTMSIVDELSTYTTYDVGSLSATQVAWIDKGGTKPSYVSDGPTGYIDNVAYDSANNKLTFNVNNLSANAYIHVQFRVKVNEGIGADYNPIVNTATFRNFANVAAEDRLSTNGVSDTVRHYAGNNISTTKHNVTFNKTGDGINEVFTLPANIVYGEGNTVYLPTMPDGDTCEFDYWSIDGGPTPLDENKFAMPDSDVVATAVYKSKTSSANTYTVKHVFSGKDDAKDLPAYVPVQNDFTVMDGWTVAIPTADNQDVANYTFNYDDTKICYTNKDGASIERPLTETEKALAQIIVPADIQKDSSISIKQTYVRNQFSVKYEYSNEKPEGAGSLPAESQVKWGESVTVEDTPDQPEKYKFFGWYANPSYLKSTTFTNGESFVMPAEDVTLIGSWDGNDTTNKYVNIKVEADWSGSTVAAGETYPDYAKSNQYVDISLDEKYVQTSELKLYDSGGTEWAAESAPTFSKTNDGRWVFQMPDLTSYYDSYVVVKPTQPSSPIDYDVPSNDPITYDGQSHSINKVTSTTEGAVITYADAYGNYVLSDPPEYSDAGTYDTYFKVTVIQEGTIPKEVTGKSTLVINPKLITPVFDVTEKVYDKTASAYISVAIAEDSLCGDDTLQIEDFTGQFVDSLGNPDYNVGENKPILYDSTKVVVSGSCVNNYSINWSELTGKIVPRSLSVTGVIAKGKKYDGTLDAIIDSASAKISGKIDGDDLIAIISTEGKFASKDVGTGIAVSATATLSGTSASNYYNDIQCLDASGNPLTANIEPMPIIVKGISANSKTYDGSADATLNLTNIEFFEYYDGALHNKINEDLGIKADGTFKATDTTTDDPTPGDNKYVAISNHELISGTTGDKDNYSLDVSYEDEGSTFAHASIYKKTLTITGITASDKVYDSTAKAEDTDGNNLIDWSNAVITGAVESDGLTIDSVTGVFANDKDKSGKEIENTGKNVGSDKTINLTYVFVNSDGTKIAYDVDEQSQTTTASITVKYLVSNASSVKERYYNRGVDATLEYNEGDPEVDGIVDADKDKVTVSQTAMFIDKNVANDISVTISATITGGSAGDESANYVFVSEEQPSLTGNITPLPVCIRRSGGAVTKLYDGTSEATVDGLRVLECSGEAFVELSESLNFAYQAKYYESASETAKEVVDPGDNYTVKIFSYAIEDGTGVDAGLASNYQLVDDKCQKTTPGIITTKSVKVTGLAASDKTYDGNTKATADLTNVVIEGAADVDVQNGLSIDASVLSAYFDTKNAGDNKKVTFSNIEFIVGSGEQARKVVYALDEESESTALSSILPATLQISATILSKVYDGTTTAQSTIEDYSSQITHEGIVDNVVVTLSDVKFADANAGEDKTVTANYAVSGTDAGNYSASMTISPATISKKNVEIAKLNNVTKEYDRSATFSDTTGVMQWAKDKQGKDIGPVDGEGLSLKVLGTFSEYNAGDYCYDKGQVSLYNAELVGDDKTLTSNYNLVNTIDNLALDGSITKKIVSISGVTAKDKVYDGTDKVDFDYTSALFLGQVNGDCLSINANAHFVDPTAEYDKTVIIDSLDLTGDGAQNYIPVFLEQEDMQTLSDSNSLFSDAQPNAEHTTAASISKRPVDISGITAVDKEYDGTTDVKAFDVSKVEITNIAKNQSGSVSNPIGAFESPDVSASVDIPIEGFDFTVMDSNKNDVTENYTIRTQQSHTSAAITALDISKATITLGDPVAYTGEEVTQTIKSVTYVLTLVSGEKKTVTLNEGVDYNVEGNTGTKPYVYTIHFSGLGNYTGVADKLWLIVGDETIDDIGKVNMFVEKVTQDSPDSEILTSKADMITAICTGDEVSAIAGGEVLNIKLQVENIDDTIQDDSRKKLDEYAKSNDLTNGQFDNIRLLKQLESVSTTEWTEIAECKNDIEVELTVPEKVRTEPEGYTYSNFNLLRNHEGVVGNMGATYEEETGIFTFATKQFSDYSIALHKEAHTPEKKDDVIPVINNAVPPNAVASTSDNNFVILATAVAGIMLSICSLIVLNRTCRKKED